MREPGAPAPSRPRIRPIAVVATIAGVLLFIYTLQASGPREILRQLRQIGFGVHRRPRALGHPHGRSRQGVVAVRRRYRALHVRPGVQGVHHRRRRRQRAAARTARQRRHQSAADPPQHRDVRRVFVGRPREHFLQHQRRDHGHGRHARVPARLSPDERRADDHAVARRRRDRVGHRGVVAAPQPAALPQPISQARRRARRRRSRLPLRGHAQGTHRADSAAAVRLPRRRRSWRSIFCCGCSSATASARC